jgi:hypothetical protein
MVRFHSLAVQRSGAMLNLTNGGPTALEEETMSSIHRKKMQTLSADGELLVFAPPLILGFLGAPLALADALPRRSVKSGSKRNLAKRRAYGA